MLSFRGHNCDGKNSSDIAKFPSTNITGSRPCSLCGILNIRLLKIFSKIHPSLTWSQDDYTFVYHHRASSQSRLMKTSDSSWECITQTKSFVIIIITNVLTQVLDRKYDPRDQDVLPRRSPLQKLTLCIKAVCCKNCTSWTYKKPFKRIKDKE